MLFLENIKLLLFLFFITKKPLNKNRVYVLSQFLKIIKINILKPIKIKLSF